MTGQTSTDGSGTGFGGFPGGKLALFFSALFLATTLILGGCSSKPAVAPAPQDRAQAGQPDQPDQPPKGQTPPVQPPAPEYYVTDIFTLATKDEAAKGKKVVMLTFDDGPSKEATVEVLDILKDNKVKALFFVTGYGAKNEDLIKRIAAERHTLGTHTQTHANLTKLSREAARQEIVAVNETVERLTGVKPKYFRPPFGAYNEAVKGILKEAGMTWFNWSVGSLDWKTSDPNKVVRNVVDYIHPGAIVLLHDTHRHTVQALPRIIKELREKGYEFIVLQ